MAVNLNSGLDLGGGVPTFVAADVQTMSPAELARLAPRDRHLIATLSAARLMEIAEDPTLFLHDPLGFEELRDLPNSELAKLTSANLDTLYCLNRIRAATFQAWAPRLTIAQVRGIKSYGLARLIKDLRFEDNSPIAPYFSSAMKESLGLTFEQDVKLPRGERTPAPSPARRPDVPLPNPPASGMSRPPAVAPKPLAKYRVSIPAYQKNCSIISVLAFLTIAGLGAAGTLGYNLATRFSLFEISQVDSVIFIGLSLCGSCIFFKFLRKYCSE